MKKIILQNFDLTDVPKTITIHPFYFTGASLSHLTDSHRDDVGILERSRSRDRGAHLDNSGRYI